MYYDKLTEQL